MPSLPEPVVVWLSAEERAEELQRAVAPGLRLVTATTAARALELCAAAPPALLAADVTEVPSQAWSFVCAGAARWPQVPSLVAAEHRTLPALYAAGAGTLVTRIVPLSAPPSTLRRVVDEVLDGAPDMTASGAVPPPEPALDRLLVDAATAAAQVRGASVRPLLVGSARLELVLPARSGLERLRAALVPAFHLPLKLRGAPLGRALRRHPVAAALGQLSEGAELFARDCPEGGWAYVGFYPWTNGRQVTCVVGAVPDDEPAAADAVAAAHAAALESVSSFPLPGGAPAEEPRHVPEYGWVASAGYTGPDRRQRPTALLGPASFVGRRRQLPRGARFAFVDRLSRRGWWTLAAWLCLTLLDTALTWACVRRGLVVELNPVVRWLMARGPWWYALGKQGLGLAAFALVSRFEHTRAGVPVARALLLSWLLLLLWWGYVLVT